MHLDPTPIWYGHGHPLARVLAPVSWLYCLVMWLRRLGYRLGWPRRQHLPVPVVVVGNLTVGGTGKTPAVVTLAASLRARGWHPAIVTRGYGGRATDWPRCISPSTDPAQVGDEPVLLARRAGCPVVAGPDRVAAAHLALEHGAVDILLADDGLQHERLARDLEIVVLDGVRGLGNGRCLPAGPLREPVGRLAQVDLVLINGGTRPGAQRMDLVPGAAVNLRDPTMTRALTDFVGMPVHAVAAIGHPQRFFRMLQGLGLRITAQAYPDHHPFSAADLAAWPPGPVLMTEKDAVKCAPFAGPDHWYVPVTAVFEDTFMARFFEQLERLHHD
ncbi:MAG: tetraacyldisaccharide 4'-kinase [Sphingobacteriia bacterium]|nr:tetraacyldisaccharide 4'-kinase [Sphingobacteriia bacterium]NCC41092.1 tetraacyldisaccharide 4'-kinase [Gammaproteobacteria bacterium]